LGAWVDPYPVACAGLECAGKLGSAARTDKDASVAASNIELSVVIPV
jgi:hypothetical protein